MDRNAPDSPTYISHNSLNSQYSTDENWVKPIGQEAYCGLAGDIIRIIEPNTEADPIAILVQLFAAFGNIIGRNPHFRAEKDFHALKIYPALVGDTAKGRKGISWGHVTNLFSSIDSEWSKNCIQTGLSSGEGLIWAVRDPIPARGKNRGDPGVKDKRLLVIEEEFASVLRMVERHGNILSSTIRQAWGKDWLRLLTKKDSARATDTHITIIGHITKEEVIRYLGRTEIANGFGNRFLWICARRSKVLPEGGHIPDGILEPLVKSLKGAIDKASEINEIKRNKEANDLWKVEYEKLSEGKPGMFGAITARAEAYVMRLACIYALLDRSELIYPKHLKAALAVWYYSEASAMRIFGNSVGDPIADTILEAIQAKPQGIDRTEISRLFSRHVDSSKIQVALNLISRLGKARMVFDKDTGGRSREVWLPSAK